MSAARPITLTVAALGGQGGGVVLNWMVHVAEQSGYLVQATSVPGVAQRTGATIYYLEFFPRPQPGEPAPVMALMPSPGACDLVIASELAEAVRMVERGIVDTATTTLIASSHRAYTIDEKTHLSDGRADSEELLAAAQVNARQFVCFDMEALARTHGSVVSAAMLGAIAASGVLPFAVDQYESAIQAQGKGVAPSLAAFHAAMQATRHPAQPAAQTTDETFTPEVAAFPPPLQPILAEALPRLRDYQDEAYAQEYLAHLKPFIAADHTLASEVARGLALWMTFEDTIRVAQLKTRPERIERLMGQTRDGEIVHVTEFLKPRPEEIFGTLPRSLGTWATGQRWIHRLLKPFTQGQRIRTSSVSGYLLFRGLAALRRIRRSTLRFHEEHTAIRGWLQLVQSTAQSNVDAAIELAACQQLVAGYGDTHARGLANYRRIAALAPALLHTPQGTARIRALREAALADDEHTALDALIAELDLEREAA